MKRIANKKAAGTAIAVQANDDLGQLSGAQVGRLVAKKRPVTVAGKQYQLDYESLVRMVRQVTQTIGEYNGQESAYAAYVVAALRKARADMVSDLEHYFGVHWRIDEATGKSVFYV